MKLDMDTIQFESRDEIDKIMVALQESKKKNSKEVKELLELLDSMYMSW